MKTLKSTLTNQFSKKMIAALLLVSLILNVSMTGKHPEGENEKQINTNVKPTKTKTTMETAKIKKINGFSLENIVSTLQVLQEDPELAKFEFRAKNKWIKGGHNQSRIKEFYGGGKEDDSRKKDFVFDNGEPPILLGANEGANPVEFILHGLAGCMTTTMVLHAAANGIELNSVESSLEGDLDVQGFLGLNDQIRNGYQQIRVNFTIEGDITEEQKQKLESFVRKSPVFDIVTNQVPVQVSLHTN